MKTELTAWFSVTLAFSLGIVAMTSLSGCQQPTSPDTAATGPEAPDEAVTEEVSTETSDPQLEQPDSEPPTEPEEPQPPASEIPLKEPAQTSETTETPEEPKETKPAPAGEPTETGLLPGENKSANAQFKPGDWPQWAGTGYKNNTPIAKNIPSDFDVGGFDRKTGEWKKDEAKNIKWVANLGSQTYGNPVVAGGKVYVGTNNGGGWLKRYPSEVDLGCLLCFSEADGTFLWQHSSEKLPTGRVHDWPLQGICCAPYVEGNRLWFVTSRGEVRCLDTEGFHDDEDDGPVQNEQARLFDINNSSKEIYEAAIAGLNEGSITGAVREEFARVDISLPDEVEITADESGKKWSVKADVTGSLRDFTFRIAGPRLSVFKTVTADDKEEADTIWAFDMMKDLAVSQHNMCSCSVTALGDILFVNTSNGVSFEHELIPSPNAPSFIAMDKNTGKVLWTDKSPGENILHGQWSSPAVAELGGVPQVIFAGGDGWIYSFKADEGTDGKPTLLWKFDANPKESKWILDGRGTRNNIIATPVIYDGLVYVAVGQDPEHGEGEGHLWCINPTKKLDGSDVSPQLAMKVEGGQRVPIPHKRLQAVIAEEGEVAVDNPDSAVNWHYSRVDQNGDGEFDFEEELHRSCGTVAIKDDILYIADFSGLVHCLDAKGDRKGNPKVYWTHDMLAASWGSPLIVDSKVFIGDEDGELSIFNLSKEAHDPIEIYMGSSVYSTPVVANDVLYISTKDKLFAIQGAPEAAE
jgi:hypothetical protein